ncbi:MAG: peptidoglycan-binding protein [Clostridium sp.]|nr:peptidoglycan-binding protein [Clostridium sp.]
MEKQKSSSIITNKGIIINRSIIIIICAIVAIYVGTAIYFKNHFYLGSKINGINVSGKTVEEVESTLESKFKSYSLTLQERNNLVESISADEICLNYSSGGKIEEFKNNQSSLLWIIDVFRTKSTVLTGLITYDENKLNSCLENLKGVVGSDIVKPKSASVVFEDGEMKVVEEVQGNKINMETLKSKVNEAILNSVEAINLNDEDCYEKPKYISTDSELQQAKEVLSKYTSSSITYTFGNDSETLTGDTISKWLSLDDDLNVVFDEKLVKKYVLSLANKYNTTNIKRKFKTSYGNTVQVPAGDYGWRINISKESEELINNIKDGQTITKEPVYAQKAYSHTGDDIGDTYVEVNLSKQHLYFYKKGSLVVDSDVVTGNVNGGTPTPTGVYMVKYKEKDSTLKGENYQTPVKYWMPFNNGIGFHDAWWRTVFGGNEYLNAGSHGCVNCPTQVAQTLYENIDAGTAVVVYY